MNGDPNSLERIRVFMAFLQQAKRDNLTLSFHSTPTEHGDNITVMATVDDTRISHGMLFWDVNLLQEHGLVETLDEDDKALGLTITDGILEDADKILAFAESEIDKRSK